mgnify:CR=1 FL=1
MKLTVKSLSDKQLGLLKKTNDLETSLTVVYMDALVSIVESHGIAEMIGREHLSLAGTAVDVVFKGKVKMGYPNTDKAREKVRGMCSPIWKLFIAPTISEGVDDNGDPCWVYDHEKLVQFQADVKSGKRSICKEKKAQGGGSGGNGGSKNQTVQERFAEALKYLDKVTAVHKRKEILEWMAEEIAKRS